MIATYRDVGGFFSLKNLLIALRCFTKYAPLRIEMMKVLHDPHE